MSREDLCRGLSPPVQDFLDRRGGRSVDLPEIVDRIDDERVGRKWPGMDRWIAEEGAGWVNSMTTLVLSIPLAWLAWGPPEGMGPCLPEDGAVVPTGGRLGY